MTILNVMVVMSLTTTLVWGRENRHKVDNTENQPIHPVKKNLLKRLSGTLVLS